MEGVGQASGRRCASDVEDLLRHMLKGEGIELDPLGPTTVFELGETRAHGMLGGKLTRPERDDCGEPFGALIANEEREQVKACAVGPVHVLDHERHRLLLAEAAVYLAALGPLMPPPPPGAPGPFALSAPGALEGLATEAGLTPGDAAEVSCPWTFPDLESALTALLSSGPAIKAIRSAGEAAARDAVTAAIEPFRQPSGGYVIGSAFRYLITTA